MPLTIEPQRTAGERIAAFRVTGTPVPDEGRDLVSHLRDGIPDRAEEIHLDLAGVTAMPDDLARALVSLWRDLQDRGTGLRITGTTVVVGWVLARHLGPVAAEVLGDERWAVLAGGRKRAGIPVDRQERPERDVAVRLQFRLREAADPVAVEREIAATLTRCGLAAGVVLAISSGGRLLVPGSGEVHPVPASGWLGSLLASADCPLATDEIDLAGLTLEERALLKWSGADLLVPLLHGGELRGLLLLRSGREAGLAGYRSGEVLALDLLGRSLAGHLAAVAGRLDGTLVPGSKVETRTWGGTTREDGASTVVGQHVAVADPTPVAVC